MVEVLYTRSGLFQIASIISDSGFAYSMRGLTKASAARRAFKLYARMEGR